MGLEYLQLWADMEALFEPYDDAQRGRLMMAMMAYAYRGEEPNFTGVEKFIWPVLRQHIDRCAANVEAKKAAGSKGGKNKQAEKQNEAEASKSKQTQADASESKQNAHNHDHDNDHDQDHNHNQEQEDTARAREGAPAAATGTVVAFDGTDITDIIAKRHEVERLIKRYRLTDNDTSMDALLDDVDRYGMDAVIRALDKASLSDSYGGLSINFYRKFIGDQTPLIPHQKAEKQDDTTNPFLKMLMEEGYGT